MLFALVQACAEPLPDAGCVDQDGRVACAHRTTPFSDGIFERELHWALPAGEAPEEGWPVAIGFQGSLFSAELAWDATEGDLFGATHQARLTKILLEAGFAVLTPEAWGDGLTCWNTNLPPWAGDWEAAPDHQLMLAIFAAIEAGELGPLDPDRLHAFGISSGGYMTSRMSDYGRFDSLVVVAGSWETCLGLLCVLPEELPDDHPPTLFLHGEADLVVPVGSMWPYHDALAAQGTEVDAQVGAGGHAWSAEMPEAVLAWFDDGEG